MAVSCQRSWLFLIVFFSSLLERIILLFIPLRRKKSITSAQCTDGTILRENKVKVFGHRTNRPSNVTAEHLFSTIYTKNKTSHSLTD